MPAVTACNQCPASPCSCLLCSLVLGRAGTVTPSLPPAPGTQRLDAGQGPHLALALAALLRLVARADAVALARIPVLVLFFFLLFSSVLLPGAAHLLVAVAAQADAGQAAAAAAVRGRRRRELVRAQLVRGIALLACRRTSCAASFLFERSFIAAAVAAVPRSGRALCRRHPGYP